MSKDNKAVEIFNEINTSIDIGLDEVVSIFVSKYEDNLYVEKKRIEGDIKANAGRQTANKEAILASRTTDIEDFVNSISTTGPVTFNFEVSKPQVNLHGDTNVIDYDIQMDVHEVGKPRTDTGYSRNTVGITKTFDIPAEFVTEREGLNKVKAALEDELMTVLANINDISRKERKVRGEISARKLEEAGMEDILTDEGMLKLVQL